MVTYFFSFVTSFCAVFLKGFQHKNVIGDHKRAVFYTSFLMAVFDVAAISLVVKGGWSVAISAGLGASLGMISSMTLHDKIFKPKDNNHINKQIGKTMTIKRTPVPYVVEDTYVIRPLCPIWITERMAERNEATEDGAIQEAVEMLLEHLGDQVLGDGEIAVHFPNKEGDPYVVVMVKDKRNDYERRRDDYIADPVKIHQIPVQNNLMEEFEDLIYTLPEGAGPDALRKDANGRYLNPKTIGAWRGFQMYHYNLTIAARANTPSKFNRCLGRYILGTLSRNGSPVVMKSPYTHTTKASAMEEANRISIDQGKAVAVFRCLDVIEAFEIPETETQQETAEQE